MLYCVISLDDEAEYECQVLGPPILRAPVSLYVDIRPADISMAAVGQVKANVELEVSCEVGGARPRAEIVLLRAGAEYPVTSSEQTEEVDADTDLVTTSTKFQLTPRASDNGISFSCCALHPWAAQQT